MRQLVVIIIVIATTLAILFSLSFSSNQSVILDIQKTQLDILIEYAYNPLKLFDYNFRNNLNELFEIYTQFNEYLHPDMKLLSSIILCAYGLICLIHSLIIILILKIIYASFLRYRQKP